MENKDIKERLYSVERTICTYTQTNEFVREINIDNIPFETLSTIVSPKNDDPLLYDGYLLTAHQLNRLNSLINIKIEIDLDSFFYVLECSGIYN
ncbi:DUF7683 domain-containing protein [Flavitalea sp.]